MSDQVHPHIKQGLSVIKQHAKLLPDSPGVYRMIDKHENTLYVGKAKSLIKRVKSYTSLNGLSFRIQRMIAETADMIFIQTETEAEALLLESNLIKKLKPRYNILLRDDKSFPYLLMTQDHDFPLLTKHRGAQKAKGHYFGPFANVSAVNRTLAFLQKVFMIRNCSDNVFANRKRPCLQYHIKRCTAPCVGYVTKDEYAEQIRHVLDFMQGKSQDVQKTLSKRMQAASENMEYEEAAKYRDRIKALSALQGKQDINIQGLGDLDVLCLVRKENKVCIQVFFFRTGQNYGNKAYFPRHSEEDSDDQIFASFLAQFYESKPVPPEIVVNMRLSEASLLEHAFNSKPNILRKTKIIVPARGKRKRLIDFVVKNADQALEHELLKRASEIKTLRKVSEHLELAEIPERIEIYDNSHISGTDMVGAMVVAGPEGLQKNAYRKFNIKTAAAADDYGMMREVMERRFGRALREGKISGTEDWPDVLLIDGGKGQLSAVYDVLDELGVADDLCVVAIAKGPDRNAGRETFFMRGRSPFTLPKNDPAMHYFQRLRDEAHRFAIGAHRTRKSNKIKGSSLDLVPGIGAKRKKALLHYFGSAKNVENAALEDLMAVEGISKSTAETLYNYFH